MAYEQILAQGKTKTGPTLTIKTDGKLRLNSAATYRFREEAATRVALLWDWTSRKIALRIADDNDITAFRLSYDKRQASADIAARVFLKIIAWPSKMSATDVSLSWNAEQQMFEGSLPATND